MGLLGRLLCSFGRHDWDIADAFENEHTEKVVDPDGDEVVYHYSGLFPVEYECARCGETNKIEASEITAYDSEGAVIKRREL